MVLAVALALTCTLAFALVLCRSHTIRVLLRGAGGCLYAFTFVLKPDWVP